MLLTGEELADVIDSITPPRQIGRKLSEQDISAIADCMGEVAVQVAKAQLLKCHQSESAEIASLQADIEELNILSRCNSEVYDTRIKELEASNKCLRDCYNKQTTALSEAKQDARKKQVRR